MPGIWCNEGTHQLMGVYFKGVTAPTIYLGLYYNLGQQPVSTMTLAGLYSEPSTGGYARIALAGSDFTLTANQVVAAVKTFTPTGADWGPMDGWFICDVASGTAGKLIAIQPFSDGPYNLLDGVATEVIAALNAT